MASGAQELLAFNRGRISRHALARLDLKRSSMSAEVQTNWLPMELGPMMLRPGTGHLGQIASTSHRLIPFVFAVDDTALIEVSAGSTRFWVNDALLTSSSATAVTITNGTFDTNITGWTDADEGSAVSGWVTGGFMGLTGTGDDAAIRYQQITTVSGSEYRLRISILRGPVIMRIGSTASEDDYFRETTLGAGEHLIAVTPTSTSMYLQLMNRELRRAVINSVTAVTASTVLSVTNAWTADELDALRWVQSGDVIYVASGIQQYKIERRTGNSWSVVKYEPLDGPFRVENTGPITITSSALTGQVTLTASKALWRSEHVGSLWRISSIGQTVTSAIASDNTFTNSIKVTGVGSAGRTFGVVVSGTFTGTINVQRSFDNLTWADIGSPFVLTAPVNTTYYDELENQIIWYRIGIKTGDYTSGTATCTLTYSTGSIDGVAKITLFGSSTSVTADILVTLGGTTATDVWAEGEWSDRRGWPTSVAIHDGRLWWAGKDKIWGSITDAYESFDAGFEGDAGPISRSIGFGPVDRINWLLSLGRLAAGTASAEVTFRSSSFDEPLTPTNFTPKETSTQGSGDVAAVKVDGRGVFVQRCGSRIYSLVYDVAQNDYVPEDMTQFIPDIGSPGITRIAVQRQPDTRIHCVRSDGTVALLLFNKAEQLVCWIDFETRDGDVVQDVCILPGDSEDAVYYSVKRTANSVETSRLEKHALLTEARGAAVTKLADAFVYAAGASTTLTGLSHLEGLEVVLWGNGKDQGTATVSGGSVTFPESCTHRVAGLVYTAQFKSTKLAYMAPQGKSGLGAKKRIHRLGVVLADTHAQGLQYGRDFDSLDDMPLVEQWAEVDGDAIHTEYEEPLFSFPGEWSTDARLCLQAQSPRPCTVLAAVIDMEANAK